MKKLKQWWITFINPTPKKWKKIRNTCVLICAIVVALGTDTIGVKTPMWFINYSWYVFGFFTALGLIAQSHETKNETT